MKSYDVITVGGGLAGAALARSLAEEGLEVLVLERETQFRDRVRGEQMHPWGVEELRKLGLYDAILDYCGHELPWTERFLGPHRVGRRDLLTTTPQQAPELSFFHPDMQELLFELATEAGAETCRGARVTGVEPGPEGNVSWETADGAARSARARLVVGCDGRGSLVRRWAGFEVKQDSPARKIAGLLFDGSKAPAPDTAMLVMNPPLGRIVALFPQREGRLRAYLVWPSSEGTRLQGEKGVARFIEESVRTGTPPDCYEGARAIGPLATFDCADTWVPHPYKNGVALLGDAAASNDPSYGEGLSLTVRGVRVLRDRLLEDSDWDRAGHAYAKEQVRSYAVIHQVTGWYSELFLAQGKAADERRSRALPLIAEDPTRVPDHVISGPDLPFDESMRARFFGEI